MRLRLLDSHIRNTVLLAMGVVVALLVSLELVFALVEEMGELGGAYELGDALLFVLLTAPTRVYELLPFTALGGALIGLGVLASNNELVVMQAAGIPTSRIVYSVLKPTAGVMLLSLVLGEYVAPPLEQRAQSDKALQRSDGGAPGIQAGTWHKIGDSYIHINAIAPGGEVLYGLSRYEMDGARRLHNASFAESASYVREEGHWLLQDVRRSFFMEGAIDRETVTQEVWRVDLSPQLLRVLLVEPDRQSISGLRELAGFFEAQGAEAAVYYLSFWKKLLQPLATLSLVILAISFVFGPLREATMGYRVSVALGIGLGFTIAQRLVEPASLLWGFSPALATFIPIGICAAVGLGLLLRK